MFGMKADNTYKENVIAAKLGFTDQEDKILVPFYVKKYLYGYGVIHKNDLSIILDLSANKLLGIAKIIKRRRMNE